MLQEILNRAVDARCSPTFTAESGQQVQFQGPVNRGRMRHEDSNQFLQNYVNNAAERFHLELMIAAITNAVRSGELNQDQLVAYLSTIQSGVNGVYAAILS